MQFIVAFTNMASRISKCWDGSERLSQRSWVAFVCRGGTLNVCFSETGVIGAVWIRWIYFQSSVARRGVGVSPSFSRFCSPFGSWSRRTFSRVVFLRIWSKLRTGVQNYEVRNRTLRISELRNRTLRRSEGQTLTAPDTL
jgi:hypothetical protein